MKKKKKQFLRKFLAYILTVVILSISVGDAFTSVQDISIVHAVGLTAIGYDVMYSLCEYLGSAFLGYSCGRTMPELSSDDVAKLGHDLALAMFGSDAV